MAWATSCFAAGSVDCPGDRDVDRDVLGAGLDRHVGHRTGCRRGRIGIPHRLRLRIGRLGNAGDRPELAAGRQLGAVTSISESTNSQPQPMRYANAAPAAAGAMADVPIQAGSQDVTVDVAVTWAIN